MSESGAVSTAVLDVRGVVKTYRGAATPANDGIDLDVQAGEVFGLLGPNGAGKSTLVRQLAGLTRPDGGSITLFGHDLGTEQDAAASYVAYLAQDEPALDDLPVALAVETTARLRGLARAQARSATTQLLDELDLGPLADRPLARLSGGQRRLACVAAAPGSLPRSRPNNVMVPLSGRVRPASCRTNVLLPAPFGPSRPNTSPACTSRLTPSLAGVDVPR